MVVVSVASVRGEVLRLYRDVMRTTVHFDHLRDETGQIMYDHEVVFDVDERVHFCFLPKLLRSLPTFNIISHHFVNFLFLSLHYFAGVHGCVRAQG